MNFLCVLSIKQKLWGGFALILAILVISGLNTLWSASSTKNKVLSMTQEIQPALITSMELRSVLKDATTSLGFFSLTNEALHKQNFQEAVSKIDNIVQTLAHNQVVENHAQSSELIKEIQGDVEKFKSYETRMFQLAGDLQENFLVLGYARDNINPISQVILQGLSNMMASEAEEEFTDERLKLTKTLSELRYLWMQVIANIRIYMFYGNDDALSNVVLFLQGVKDLVTKFKTYEELHTFQQEEGIAQVEEQVNKWDVNLQKLIKIQKSDKARLDAYLIKTEIGPLIARINDNLIVLVDAQRGITTQTSAEIVAQADNTTNVITFLLIFGVGLGSVIAFLITSAIVMPINRAVEVMNDIAQGEGDLTRRLDQVGSDEVSRLTGGFNKFAQRLQELIKQVSEFVMQLITASNELSTAAERVNSTITQQQAETSQIITAVSQMSDTSKVVAQNANEAAEVAQDVDTQTSQNQQIVLQALSGINNLADETQSTADVITNLGSDIQGISAIIDVIRDITEQTNLLALNAAIEAARAGEQGRGFAVVADEVRTLANRTKQSTLEISKKIESLQSESKEAVVRMEKNREVAQSTATLTIEAGESLGAITAAVADILTKAQQIAGAATQQSKVAEEVYNNVSNINELTQATSDAAANVAQSSNGLNQMSASLKNLVGQFKV